VTDLITSVLLFAQFSIVRSRALAVLASGYLFVALIVIPWMLMFPGDLCREARYSNLSRPLLQPEAANRYFARWMMAR
jgi:hypothetical protein